MPELIKDISALDTSRLQKLCEIIDREMPTMQFAHAPALYFENTQISVGKGGVGPGGDAKVKGTKGGLLEALSRAVMAATAVEKVGMQSQKPVTDRALIWYFAMETVG